jgi:hypothetical protein
MQKHVVLLFTIIFVTTFTSCNKNKRNAKTLEGSIWLVNEISIDGKDDTLHPKLEFFLANGTIQILQV